MSKPPQRDIIKIIFNNFIRSFKPRQIRGNFMGEDYFGNKFYEIPPNPSIGKRRPTRWFEPSENDAFDQEITAEWEAWLRLRRDEPPTREELVQNLQIMEMKKRNAAELNEKYTAARGEQPQITQPVKGPESFPRYQEYEHVPGKGSPNK